MKKINFKDIKIMDLSGVEVPDLKMHEIVANALIRQATGSPIRNMEFARKIFNDGEVELLSEDIQMIRNAILISNTITDIAKEAILKALELE